MSEDFGKTNPVFNTISYNTPSKSIFAQKYNKSNSRTHSFSALKSKGISPSKKDSPFKIQYSDSYRSSKGPVKVPMYSLIPKSQFNDKFKKLFSQRVYGISYEIVNTSPIKSLVKSKKYTKNRPRSPEEANMLCKGIKTLQQMSKVTRKRCISDLRSIWAKYRPYKKSLQDDYVEDCIKQFRTYNEVSLHGNKRKII